MSPFYTYKENVVNHKPNKKARNARQARNIYGIKDAYVECMRPLMLITMLMVCLISNNARSDIRISEHLCDVVSEAVLTGFDESFCHREEAAGRRGDPHSLFFIFPVDGRVSSFFGRRKDPFHKAVAIHKGIDVAYKTGSPVLAAGPGHVSYAGWLGGCGNMCVVDHGKGLSTRYCHLNEVDVRKGQEVAFGQRLGSMGASGRATGSHLHFEVRRGGVAVDPAEYLAF
ncbi:MAG: M23 family metallopeptidase [Pseudomonadota bacterium]